MPETTLSFFKKWSHLSEGCRRDCVRTSALFFMKFKAEDTSQLKKFVSQIP